MEEAIEHNWQVVVFKDTEENYQQWKQGETNMSSRPKSRMDQLQDDMNYIHNFFNGGQDNGQGENTSPDDQ